MLDAVRTVPVYLSPWVFDVYAVKFYSPSNAWLTRAAGIYQTRALTRRNWTYGNRRQDLTSGIISALAMKGCV